MQNMRVPFEALKISYIVIIDNSKIVCYNISIEGTTANEPRVDRDYSLIRAIAHELVTPVRLLRVPLFVL